MSKPFHDIDRDVWYESERACVITYQYERAEKYGRYNHRITRADGTQLQAFAHRVAVESGALVLYCRFQRDGDTEYVGQVFAPGTWTDCVVLSAMDGTPTHVVDDDRWWDEKGKKVTTDEQKRRNRERGRITPTVRYAVLKRDRFACKACGAHGKTTELHVDHIVAVANGGTSDLENLQTLCSACNSGKGARE